MTRRDDLDQRLDDWLRTWNPAPPPDLLGKATRAAVATKRRRAWRIAPFFAVAAAGGTVAAAVVIGVALSGLPRYTGDATRPPAASASVQPSVEPSTKVSPTSTAEPSEAPVAVPPAYAEWERSAMPDISPAVYGGVVPEDVVVFNGMYVAVGNVNAGCCTGGYSDDSRVVAWTSRDAASWSLVESPAFAHGLALGIATDGTRIVAVGAVQSPAPPGETHLEIDAAVWVTEDGQTWLLIEDAPQLDLVAAGGSGFIGFSHTDGIPSVWTSADGTGWVEVAQNPALGPAPIRAIARGPSGLFVAVGGDDVRVSDNGLDWTRVDDQPAFEEAEIGAIAHDGQQFVAIGAEDSGSGLAWTSEDGTTWERVATFADDRGWVYPDQLVAAGDSLIASGATANEDRTNQPAIWVSQDATEWIRVPAQEARNGDSGGITGLTVAGDGSVIAVGHIWDTASMHPVPTSWRSDDDAPEGGSSCAAAASNAPSVSPETVLVYFTCSDTLTPPDVYAVTREAASRDTQQRLATALQELLEGPSADEAAMGYTSWFSSATAGSLNAASVTDGRAVIDFADLSTLIPNASTSNGSRMLLAQLGATVFQFDDIDTVEYRFDGNCDAFWTWLPAGECQVLTRADVGSPPVPPWLPGPEDELPDGVVEGTDWDLTPPSTAMDPAYTTLEDAASHLAEVYGSSTDPVIIDSVPGEAGVLVTILRPGDDSVAGEQLLVVLRQSRDGWGLGDVWGRMLCRRGTGGNVCV